MSKMLANWQPKNIWQIWWEWDWVAWPYCVHRAKSPKKLVFIYFLIFLCSFGQEVHSTCTKMCILGKTFYPKVGHFLWILPTFPTMSRILGNKCIATHFIQNVNSSIFHDVTTLLKNNTIGGLQMWVQI